MLKDLTGIRFRGANFDTLTDVLFLDTHEGNKTKKVKGALLYGRNGAGKSTLAKAVKKAKGDDQDTILQVWQLLKSGTGCPRIFCQHRNCNKLD